MRFALKRWIRYWFEMGLGAVILYFSVRLFLLYAFCYLIFLILDTADGLRRVLRVFQVANETKIALIGEKLGLTQEDYTQRADRDLASLSDEQRASLENDIKGISWLQ